MEDLCRWYSDVKIWVEFNREHARMLLSGKLFYSFVSLPAVYDWGCHWTILQYRVDSLPFFFSSPHCGCPITSPPCKWTVLSFETFAGDFCWNSYFSSLLDHDLTDHLDPTSGFSRYVNYNQSVSLQRLLSLDRSEALLCNMIWTKRRTGFASKGTPAMWEGMWSNKFAIQILPSFPFPGPTQSVILLPITHTHT